MYDSMGIPIVLFSIKLLFSQDPTHFHSVLVLMLILGCYGLPDNIFLSYP